MLMMKAYVTVDMTLTSMGCPMGPQIIDQVKTVLAETS